MKKVLIGVLVFLICIISVFLFFDREEESIVTDVVEKTQYGLLVNYEDGLIAVDTGDAEIVDRDGKENTLDCINEGDRIEIIYDGKIEETYPAQINNVYKIIIFLVYIKSLIINIFLSFVESFIRKSTKFI